MLSDLSDEKAKENKERKKSREIRYEKVLNKMKQFFLNYSQKFKDIESVVLFGSHALKNFNKDSDIDLCIIFKDNRSSTKENEIHDFILDLSKVLERIIDVLYIHPEMIEKIDHTTMESILAQGQLIYGSNTYKNLFLNHIKLRPYQAISFTLKHLDASDKMKFKRMLYGYKTSVKHSGNNYDYERPGILEKIGGRRLGSGMFLIPELSLPLFQKILGEFDIKFANFRIWKQEI